jgi:hypothetical protein
MEREYVSDYGEEVLFDIENMFIDSGPIGSSSGFFSEYTR